MDLTIGYEYEMKYHNAWEFFGNAYLKWDECASCDISARSRFGTTTERGGLGGYKPRSEGRNHHGNLRLRRLTVLTAVMCYGIHGL